MEKRYLLGFQDVNIPDWTEIEFASPFPTFTACFVCGSLACEVMWAQCWHVFCYVCYGSLEANDQVVCPFDKTVTPSSRVRRDRLSSSVILNFTVYCSNKSKGCRHVCPLKDLQEHSKVCGYYPVRCQTCGSWISRQDLISHHRRECRGANPSSPPESQLNQASTSAGSATYPELRVIADAMGGDNLFSGDDKTLEIARLISTMREISKEYEIFKNSFNSVKENLNHQIAQIRSESEELQRILISDQRTWKNQILSEILNFRASIRANRFDWQILTYNRIKSEALGKKDIKFRSETFYVGFQGYHVALSGSVSRERIQRTQRLTLHLYIHLLKGLFDCNLEWPYVKKTTIRIVDQENRTHDIVRNLEPARLPEDAIKDSFDRPVTERNLGYEVATVSLVELENPLRKYILDDTIIVQLLVDFM